MKKEERFEQILDILTGNPMIRSDKLARVLDVKISTLKLYIREMRKKNLISRMYIRKHKHIFYGVKQ